MEPLTLVSISLPLNELLALVFYLVLAGYILFSVIFYYHWQAYAANASVTFVTILVYALTTLPLIVAMGSLIVFF